MQTKILPYGASRLAIEGFRVCTLRFATNEENWFVRRRTVKHVIYFVAAAVGALAVSVILATFGAHGRLGAVAVYTGLPGGFVNWKANPGGVSYVLITIVNTAVYLTIFEVLGLVIYRRHLAKR